jgi:hypothetical protein
MYTTPNPDVRLFTNCYNGGAPNPPNQQFLPSGAISNVQPYIGNFPANSDFGVIVEIIPGGVGSPGCNADVSGFILSVSQPAKRALLAGNDSYVPLPDWN